MREQVHIVVSGRVQGVNFRRHTEQAARRLGLDGCVKNLPDGDVEIVAEGESEKLLELVAWARKGPPSARVTDARVRFSTATGWWCGFRTEY